MQVQVDIPKFIITWAQDAAGVQIPLTVPMYCQIKRLSDNVVIFKQFDTAGGYHGANNHTSDFRFMLEEGNYEVIIKALHRNRLFVQSFFKRHDDVDSNSSSSAIAYAELKSGQQMKFTMAVVAYNSGGTQWYKLNTLAWFENKTTHQFAQKNPTPPTLAQLGSLTEAQYYAQEVCPLNVTVTEVQFQNADVPILPQTLGGVTTQRVTLPNTPTIEILNSNVNGGNPQYVSNPFYQNVGNIPATPAILLPSSGSMAMGGAISGTTTDYTNTIVVFRNGIEIATITPTQTFGSNGNWSYTPTTPQTYKFKARKNAVDSAFSDTITVTNSCNLVNNQNIATWNVNGAIFRAKSFDGGLTFRLIRIVSENPLKFEMRGKNMIQRSDMTSLGSWVLADLYNCFTGIVTGNGGLDYDDTFATPAGFVKVGNIYEQTTIVVPSAPVPASGNGIVGTMITGIANQAGMILAYRDEQYLGSVATSGGTNIWGYNPLQPGVYTFKNQNDNGTSASSIDVIVNQVTVVTSRKFRAKNINYCDILPENIQVGTSTSNAAAVTNWTDGLIIETDLLIVAGLKGFIRDKTNTARVFGVLVSP